MDSLKDFVGQEVIIDTDTPFLYLGTLAEIADDCFVLKGVDVHDRNDLNVSKEKYALETRRHGIKDNRKRVFVVKDRVVSISLLEDIIKF
ncbi:hypothetical protein ACFL4W_00930 [Planctomycetota bacterium]